MFILAQTLVHMGAYASLDLTIAQALDQRAPDFPGVVKCAATDSLGTLLQLIKKRRVHRLVVVESEVCPLYLSFASLSNEKEEERNGGKKGRLLGIITLSDVLRYLIGESAIGADPLKATLSTTAASASQTSLPPNSPPAS